MAEVTGAKSSRLRYACPIGLIHGGVECGERYNRVYDVKRHLTGAHGVQLEDLHVRILLSKAIQATKGGIEIGVLGIQAGPVAEEVDDVDS